jgi:rRNA-processing protein FCF1
MAKVNRVHKVIVDTNFLVDIVRFKLDLDSIRELLPGRCKILIPEAVKKELKRMKSKEAKTAAKMFRSWGLKTVENPIGSRGADNTIISIAETMQDKGEKVAVATNDAKLRKRLKTLGIKTIYLRARKHLEIG